MELVSEYFMAILLFFSFITLIFYGFPVAWTMGGLAVIFTLISMLSDTYLDTFFGVPERDPNPSIFLTSFMLSRTFPNTTCFPLSHEVLAVVMKN